MTLKKDRLDSIWEKNFVPIPYPVLGETRRTEICVVGGGIAGVSTAFQLAKRGHRVVLLEAFQIGSGQSGRTTAHLSCQLEEQFFHLLQMHDVDTVTKFLDAHKSAIDMIENNIEMENIHCDFKRLDGYLFRGRNFSEPDLFREQDAAVQCGINLEFCEETPLLRNEISSLRFPRQAQFNPLKYINGLLRALKDLGAHVYEGTHVHSITHKEDELVELITDLGHKVEAKFVVFATNTPINSRFYIHTKQFAYRSYAMAFSTSSPQEEVLLWDTEDPYHYIRFVDGSLVVGGEDHRSGQDPNGDPFERIEAWSRSHFSFIGDVQWKWSGQIFEPADRLPFIGVAPGTHKNVYVVTGGSGIGLTNGTIASMLLPDLIEGKSHSWESIFDPSRRPIHGLRDFVKENINVAYQYSDWITRADVRSVEEIEQDMGSLMREGVSKVCVYHDENDNFEKKSAVCTHLGGIVHWNDIEKTWDCPCHGSRFNRHGQVIEGPARSNLMEN